MKKLAEKIQELYNLEIKKFKDNTESANYEAYIQDIKDRLNSNIVTYRSLIEEQKQNGLLLNALESEGFVRACIEIKAHIENTRKYYIE